MKKEDFLPLNGTDYIEYYVSNSLQAARYYQSSFGFQPLAFSGLSTGNNKFQSYVVQQNKIKLATALLHRPQQLIKRHPMTSRRLQTT